MATVLHQIICLSIYYVLNFYSCLSFVNAKQDIFFEELYIKPLQSGHVAFFFKFTTLWNISVHETQNHENFQHYRLFPKSFGDILATYHVQELHLTQTQGDWRHQAWGHPVEDAPPGAQLWAWFKPSVTEVSRTWKDLVNSLSGLFCSSLNFLDAKATVSPRWSFRPKGLNARNYSASSDFLRYGALPREIVCTENLTPWKKLLPCNSKAGLSTLFNAEHIFDADYHSLAVHFRPVCADRSCLFEAVELTQSLTLVLDTTLKNKGYQNWSFRTVFGQQLSSYCPLASRSQIMVDTSSNKDRVKFTLEPTPDEDRLTLESSGLEKVAIYNLPDQIAAKKSINIAAKHNVPVDYGTSVLPAVYAHRYITGYGLEKGGVSCLIYNSLDTELPVLYLDIFPWFTRVFFRSITVDNAGRQVPFKVHFVPGKDREQSYLTELSFILAPKSVTKVSLQFERAFLKWTEYPPDANHGFYINSAVISVKLPSDKTFITSTVNTSTLLDMLLDGASTRFVQLYTESLLVSLPTPDFSMPYNVICLACTVVAIAFGSMHNLTTRRLVAFDPTKHKGLIVRLKALLKRGKKESSENDSAQRDASKRKCESHDEGQKGD